MQKQLIPVTLIFLLVSVNIFSQKKNFTLKGIADSQFNDMPIILFTFRADSVHRVDTTIIRNGNFTFYGKEYLEDESMLTMGNYPEKVVSVWVFLEQGDIYIDLTDSTSRLARGTPLNELMIEYDLFRQQIETKYQWIMSEADAGLISKDSINRLRYSFYQERDSIAADFKRNNISNAFGKVIFKKGLNNLSDPYFDELYALADKNLQSDSDVRAYIKKRENNKIQMLHRGKNVGKSYSDFELKTLTGISRKLSDYVGTSKYLFVDFWASWCGPCIADIPNIKKTYEKYKGKGLEVLGVSLDTKDASWQLALKRIDAPWIQLIVKENTESLVRKIYHITGIPYSILIDDQGNIIHVNLRGDTLDNILEKLLND